MSKTFKFGQPCSQVKDVDIQKRTIKAYYSNWTEVDSDDDRISKGAYTKSIADRGPKASAPRIKHLYNHWDAAGTLVELGDDDHGGWFMSKLGKHTIGKDVLMMYDDGIITEHSHGFEILSSKEETHEGKTIRVIEEGVLWEVSSLDKWGANPNTPVMKSKEHQTHWIRRIERLNKALRDGLYTDETFELLEIQLKQIQQLLYDFEPGVQPTPSPEPGQTTHLKKEPAYNKLIINYKI